jgi:PAS domain S-box-containing protein
MAPLPPVEHARNSGRQSGVPASIASPSPFSPSDSDDALYRATFEHAPAALAIIGFNHRVVQANARFAAILRWDPDTAAGRDLFDSWAAGEPVKATWSDLTEARLIEVSREMQLRREDGSAFRATMRFSLVRGADGAPLHIVAMIEDVTERRFTEEQVRLQTRLLDSVREAVIASDADGIVTYWNHFAEQLFGRTAEDAIGRSILDLTPTPASRADAAKILATIREGNTWSGEIELRRADGSVFPAEVFDAPIHDDSGRVIGVVGVSHDITERKAAENALRGRESELAYAQEIAHVGSWVWSPKSDARTWSDEGLRIFGLAPGFVVDRPIVSSAMHPDDRQEVVGAFNRAVELREPFELEFRAILPDGQLRWMRTVGRTEQTGDAEDDMRVIGIVQDVTEQRSNVQEARHRAAQQEAVATLGQVALSGGVDLTELYAAVSEILSDVLGADLCGVLQRERDVLRLVAGNGWRMDNIGEYTIPTNEGFDKSHAAFALHTGMPVLVENFATETRFGRSALLERYGAQSGIAVPIAGSEGGPWGLLSAHFKEPRTFSEHDASFMRGLATVLGQAIERSGIEAKLRARAIQQSAVAELGWHALARVGDDTIQRARELIQVALEVDETHFLAGSTGDAQPTSESAVVHDSRGSTICVPVAGPDRRFGLLSASSTARREFTEGDVQFVQAIANILAEAIDHEATLEELVASEERHRSVVEGATEIIFTTLPDGTITSINPAFEVVTGLRAAEWIGTNLFPLLHPSDIRRAQEAFHSLAETAYPLSFEARLIGAEGRIVLLAITAFARESLGRVEAIYGFARDITDERRARAEHDALTRDLQLLLESTAEGIYTTDLQGRCTMINAAAAKILGRQRDEIIGQEMHSLLHNVHRGVSDVCPIAGVASTGLVYTSAEETFRRADGSAMPVEYSAAPIIDAGAIKGVVVTFTDINQRLLLEAKLEQAHRVASLGRLAATVAHEFNNVLMGISPFVDVLRRDKTGERVPMVAEQIGNSVKRGKRVTEEILRFTQPSEPVLSAIEAAPWLQSVATEVQSVLSSRHTLDVSVEDATLAIAADANQLAQVLINLIHNARDAMPEGGTIVVRARRELPGTQFDFGVVADPERYLHLIVQDSGVGMDAETLRVIFEPLFTTKKNGTGLGLAVAHQVVQRHRGEIFVDSRIGAGTAFHLFIPLTAAPPRRVEGPVVETAPRVTVRRILLVEDERAVSAGLIELLGIEGVKVDLVETGGEVLEAIDRFKPEAVVLDIGLPDVEGTRVYESIAYLHPALPVIFSTGHGDQSKLEAHLTKPNVAFLLKPYDVDVLLKTLEQVVA